ncbi:MAG TPA: hypothetical protein VH331_09935 [Allosphingosinicella sp.]|jgi:hypothetical protein|nr:hypothetical protein [Allosphingosinicella sp.]
MFTAAPTARADLKAGALYAFFGEGGWIYYGQVTAEKKVAFFRCRDRELGDSEAVLATPVMCLLSVAYPSITRALRSGRWTKLGRHPLSSQLQKPQPSVNWPVGTLTVTVCIGDSTYDTRVDDPAIQDMELMAVWDAEAHVPARLTADFGVEPAQWHVGGPIRRERRIKEEMAQRFPDQPWHQLPGDWVPTSVR